MDGFLEPSVIDWRLPAADDARGSGGGDAVTNGRTVVVVNTEGGAYCPGCRERILNELADTLDKAGGADVELCAPAVSIGEPVPDGLGAGGEPIPEAASAEDLSCLWHLLFRPSESLTRQTDRALAAMGVGSRPFAAAHLRLGGMDGEEGRVVNAGRLGCGDAPQRAAIACASALAQGSEGQAFAAKAAGSMPLVIVTDNKELRKRVRPQRCH